jgi:flagellar basal body-associated protein FliL
MDPQSSQTPNPVSAPAQKSNSLVLTLAILLILIALAAGAYFVWGSDFWRMWLPQSSQETPQTPAQTETSDIEAELESVEVGSDAEIDSLEAQL